MRVFRLSLPLLAVLAIASCRQEEPETWGFIATLGNDTTAVERITRSGNHITSDAIGRSPLVVRRRWEAVIAPDGSVARWKMDTHIANAPAGESELHHELDVDNGVLHLVRQVGKKNTDRASANPYALTVPWNAFVYGTYELLFHAARSLPDTVHVGQYFFEGWSEGNVGFARLRRIDPKHIAIRSTGLAGEGIATLDDAGHMMSYSGAGTTYKQEVRRATAVPDLDAIFARFAADEKAKGSGRSLSVRDTVRARIGNTDIVVDYSRPLARGRTLLGGLIPYDSVWRTGANAATQIFVSTPIRIAGVPLDSGGYTLWTIPGRERTQLIINRQTGQWGTGYQARFDVARAPMMSESLGVPVERFTIRVDTVSSRLVMEWGTFRWRAPITAR